MGPNNNGGAGPRRSVCLAALKELLEEAVVREIHVAVEVQVEEVTVWGHSAVRPEENRGLGASWLVHEITSADRMEVGSIREG